MSVGDGFDPRDHVTEREPGPWRDCTFASMLETMRLGFPDGELIPATEAEKEAYRAAAGLPDDHAGATLEVAIAAAEKRYGLASGYQLTKDWLAVREALVGPAGTLLVVQGWMGSVTTYLRRWDATFMGAHSIAGRAPLWWCDPLAPKGTYAGEQVSIATWQAYFTGLIGAKAFITKVGGLNRAMSGDFHIYDADVQSQRTGLVRSGAPFYNDWQMTDKRGAMSADSRVQLMGYRGDAVAVQVTTAQGWSDGKPYPTLVFIAKTRISGVAVAPPTGDVKHTVTLSIDGQQHSTTEV